jgi:hypothetical protein
MSNDGTGGAYVCVSDTHVNVSWAFCSHIWDLAFNLINNHLVC